MRMARAGTKVGGNYVQHYLSRLSGRRQNKEELHSRNARDLYDALGDMKGSVLKLAQMMSMDQGVLPAAYAKQFQMAQYSAPPLSGPLVRKTIKKYLGRDPEDIFDQFSSEAVAAASIGQVHRAELDGKPLAVKIQYPGVADSIASDIAMAKPFALRMLEVKESEVKDYISEVTAKLIEETDYTLELQQSVAMSEACSKLPGVHFPQYYPALSSARILVMDWIEGQHIDQWLSTGPDQEAKNKVGQAIWDFYNFQIHALRKVHADPHPGNFLIDSAERLWVIDFGCVKALPDPFYADYFGMLNAVVSHDRQSLEGFLTRLHMLLPDDDAAIRQYLCQTFEELISLMARPMMQEEFDFGDVSYFNAIYARGEALQKDPTLRTIGAGRGPKDALYVHRTYFGLYSILHQLKARITTRQHLEEYVTNRDTAAVVS